MNGNVNGNGYIPNSYDAYDIPIHIGGKLRPAHLQCDALE